MAADGLHSAATTVAPEAPPPVSRTDTATDSVFASDGRSTLPSAASALTEDGVSSSSHASDSGELELERSIREKELMLEEARAQRREIERRLAELERLREEVGQKVQLAGIARKVFGELTADEDAGEPPSLISPQEIATYWDSLASDIEGLDLRVKEQLGIQDEDEAEVEEGAAAPVLNGVNGSREVNRGHHDHEEDSAEEEEEEEEEDRTTPPGIRRADTA
ncbi:hypothetical protein CALVIDRAFT_532626 [Calocera viscosa TUFC12733]|uniref:Uncharacterized protein n=1 Tax=Calocera viscosa (strain TUFC12733) TaxID=1330018 RepID=A0A167SFZ2_CALVF|nr:hypothetical protein CALVIDRAFT_532626 [Calocera viscosa TUFC12733]